MGDARARVQRRDRTATAPRVPDAAPAVRGAKAGCACADLDFASVPVHAPGKDAGTPPPVATKKTVEIYPVSVDGATRSSTTDISRADAIWAQCGVEVKETGGESWAEGVVDKLNPKGVLNEFSDPKSPTAEEQALLAHQPGGASVLHAYFVPSMSAGSRGEAFIPSFSSVSALVISDSAESDTFAHELGHVLLDDGGHHADPDNLMASGTIRNVGVDKLDAAQCAKI